MAHLSFYFPPPEMRVAHPALFAKILFRVKVFLSGEVEENLSLGIAEPGCLRL
jgi:hypothetical protein